MVMLPGMQTIYMLAIYSPGRDKGFEWSNCGKYVWEALKAAT